jgi:hypothetical protein
MFNKFLAEHRAVYEILWKNTVEAGHIWQYNMAHAHCMLDNRLHKHTQDYAILITFPRQQWLSERASILTSCTAIYRAKPLQWSTALCLLSQ